MDPGADLPQPGDVLSDKYTVVRAMSVGGMGVVYEALHNRIGQRVAIKVLHPNMRRTPEYVERFEREARAAGVLKSRYAVRVLDVAETPKGLPYMVMDFLEGRDLQAEIEDRGALPVEDAIEYLLQACAAMAEAHDLGIVHRDLKPANLFLCQDEGEVIVRVLDFGISKHSLQGDSSVTTTATAIGTPLYMSPEQVRSARTVDARADIWSLGVIAYEMLCGRTPFPGENPTATIAAIVADEVPPLRSFRQDIPEELAKVVHLALQKRPEDRYSEIRVFAAALSPFARPGTTTRIAPPRSRASLPSASSQPSLPIGAGRAPSPPPGQMGSALGRSGQQPGVTMPTWTAHGGPAGSRSMMLGALTVGLVVGLGLVVWIVRPFGRPSAAPAGSNVASVAAAASPAPSPSSHAPRPSDAPSDPGLAAAPLPAPALPTTAPAVAAALPEPSAAPPPSATSVPAPKRTSGRPDLRGPGALPTRL